MNGSLTSTEQHEFARDGKVSKELENWRRFRAGRSTKFGIFVCRSSLSHWWSCMSLTMKRTCEVSDLSFLPCVDDIFHLFELATFIRWAILVTCITNWAFYLDEISIRLGWQWYLLVGDSKNEPIANTHHLLNSHPLHRVVVTTTFCSDRRSNVGYLHYRRLWSSSL